MSNIKLLLLLDSSCQTTGYKHSPTKEHDGDSGLALQATLEVEPADKRKSLVLRRVLVIDPALIERFDSEEASNLLARKTDVLELLNIRHGGELFS